MLVGEYEFDKDLLKGEHTEDYIIKYLESLKYVLISRGEARKEYDVKMRSPSGKVVTFEIKSDAKTHQTGNICVEYFSRGKESGISVTEADYWVHVIVGSSEGIYFYVLPMDKMRDFADHTRNYRTKVGGDPGSNTTFFLIPEREFAEFRYPRTSNQSR